MNKNGENKVKSDKDKGQEKDAIVVDVGIELDNEIDPKIAKNCLDKLFCIADKFGSLLHDEKLTIGEALFIIYLLEKGALSTISNEGMGIMGMDKTFSNEGSEVSKFNGSDENDESDQIADILMQDNETKIDIIANIMLRNMSKR